MSTEREHVVQGVSRRRFLAGSGAAAAGIAILQPSIGRSEGTDLPPVGTWPWPENGLSPWDTAGGDATGLYGCATTTFGLIIRQLTAVLGVDTPWARVPPEFASVFNGGGPYGSDCGALQGGILIMNLVGAPINLRREYYQWYCNFSFPSTDWDGLYPGFEGTIQSVSGSPLCHESRSIWEGVFTREIFLETGEYDGTRCKKLPRDCTRKAVELINAFKIDGNEGEWYPEVDFQECYDCHTHLFSEKQPGGIISGKEDCTRCHDVPRGHSRGRKN